MKKLLKKQIGNYASVLVEEVNDNSSFGKSQHFIKTKINKKINVGQIINCKITDCNDNILKGNII